MTEHNFISFYFLESPQVVSTIQFHFLKRRRGQTLEVLHRYHRPLHRISPRQMCRGPELAKRLFYQLNWCFLQECRPLPHLLLHSIRQDFESWTETPQEQFLCLLCFEKNSLLPLLSWNLKQQQLDYKIVNTYKVLNFARTDTILSRKESKAMRTTPQIIIDKIIAITMIPIMLLMTTLALTIIMKIAQTKAMTTAKAIAMAMSASTTVTMTTRKMRVTMTMSEANQCQYQNNCAPTPPLTQN